MIDAQSPIGLYSIGIKNLTMPDLLSWAAAVDIPFVHLRGGLRGHRVLEQDRSELGRWREIAQTTCPITLVTSDVTLNDLTSRDLSARTAARRLLEQTCDAASLLGARRVRVLADRPVETLDDSLHLPVGDVTVLIELHHASWWTAVGVAIASELVRAGPRVRLLADTAQAAAGFGSREPGEARALANRVIELSEVLHLSDDGSGLGASGHALLAAAARTAEADIELGFEWTGEPRTAGACLRRYRAVRIWWRGLEATSWKSEES